MRKRSQTARLVPVAALIGASIAACGSSPDAEDLSEDTQDLRGAAFYALALVSDDSIQGAPYKLAFSAHEPTVIGRGRSYNSVRTEYAVRPRKTVSIRNDAGLPLKIETLVYTQGENLEPPCSEGSFSAETSVTLAPHQTIKLETPSAIAASLIVTVPRGQPKLGGGIQTRDARFKLEASNTNSYPNLGTCVQ